MRRQCRGPGGWSAWGAREMCSDFDGCRVAFTFSVNGQASALAVLGNYLVTEAPNISKVCPASAPVDADWFTLNTTSGNDRVTKVTLSLTVLNGYWKAAKTVSIYSDDYTILYGSKDVTASGVTVDLTLAGNTPIPVDTTPRQYRIKMTPAGYGGLSFPSSSAYPSIHVTGGSADSGVWSSTNDVSAALTFDGQGPSATAASATTSPGIVQLNWTNPAGDFAQSVVLRGQGNGSVQNTSLVSGTTYATGASGADTILYVGNLHSFTDAPPPGFTYNYVIFDQDTCGSFYQGNSYPYPVTGTSVTSLVVPDPITILGDYLGAEATSVSQACPASPLTDLDHFTLATSVRTDSVTAVTLQLANPTA